MTPRPDPWFRDPSEVDRFLDGEVAEGERSGREADVASDPEARRLVEARRAFLATIARGVEAEVRDRAALAPLEARVRAALDGERRPVGRVSGLRLLPRGRIPLWTWAVSAAAVLALGIGLSSLGQGLRRADAMPREVLLAAELVRNASSAPEHGATCGVQEPTSPFRFPLVERREMGVRGCLADEPAVVRSEERALLYRVADLQVVGYVAVPDPGATPGPEIGVTRLEDLVVFDVRQGGAVYYLAVEREVVDRRGSCAACHGRSREGEKNPHLFKERRVPTLRP